MYCMNHPSSIHPSVLQTEETTNLVSKGLEFAGRAGIQIHELVSVYKQGRFFALILIFEGCEPSALHLQNTGQVSYVALKSQEASPDLAAGNRQNTHLANKIKNMDYCITA